MMSESTSSKGPKVCLKVGVQINMIEHNNDIEIHMIGKDQRGSIFRGDIQGLERFLIAEIKKGKARGGHYHNIDTFHFILLGKVVYREIHLDANGKEIEGQSASEQVYNAGSVIFTPAFSAHLIIALEDSVMVEPTGEGKTTTNYLPFRRIVEVSMSQESL